MLKVLGNFVLVVSVFLLIGGVGGAIFVFGFMGKPPVCRTADTRFKDAEEAVRKYQAAKGTPHESRAQAEADNAINSAQDAGQACGRANAYYRRNGVISGVVGLFGLIGTALGALLTIVAFRKKKLA